jgi:class 3 adenylate cyclase
MSGSDTPGIAQQLVPARETCPLPDDPLLAEAAVALRDSGYWAEIVDRAWRIVYVTDDLRLGTGGMVERVPVPLGVHHFGPELLAARERSRTGPTALGALREVFTRLGDVVLADTPGGREELRRRVDPRLRDIVDALDPVDLVASMSGSFTGYGPGGTRPRMLWTAVRLRGLDGELAGTAILTKPESKMSVLATVTALGDGRHFNRIQAVAKAGRRPAAILFADLASSSQLARRLSTPSYFSLVRRIVRAADQCVIERGGLVGRHAGDGVVAFFLAETAASESACARCCIQAARDLAAELDEVGARSNLSPGELTMRIGLHWGATLYVGQIATGGRTEVTALGDEVNECARIEACAGDGSILASKNLLERVELEDAEALGLDSGRLTYTPLAELPGASEKARRDAPAVPVCEI